MGLALTILECQQLHMHQREAHILAGVVEEYIATARPVGSRALQGLLDTRLSPATIRNILHLLEEAGYIMQPHTSAGRVPTDQGYRYFVDSQAAQALNAREQRRLLEEYQQTYEEYQHVSRALTKILARLCQAVVVSRSLTTGEMQEAGLTQMLEQPEGEDVATIREVSTLLDDIDRHVEEMATSQNVTVYIGEENPFFPAQRTSLMIRRINVPQHGEMVVMIMGPKRMSYHRNVSLLQALDGILNQPTL